MYTLICLQALLDRGAKVAAEMETGRTALIVASAAGHLGVVEVSYVF